MTKSNFKIKNVKLAFAILLILAFVIFLLYYIFVFTPLLRKNSFANQMIEITDENENTVFDIKRILLYSSAVATDNSDNLSLQNLSVSQFSDLSIYIDNSHLATELTPETTVKELYIDNISINVGTDGGTKILNYKNPSSSGKFVDLKEPSRGRINFKIINRNDDNENANYDEPTFYTDCSNPISLGFLNKDFLSNYSVSDDSNSITFNSGKVLSETGVDLEKLNFTLNFTIHLVNNSNTKFAYAMSFDVKLSEDAELLEHSGSSYKTINCNDGDYRFFKEIS